MKYIAFIKDLSRKDLKLVGGKAANLGEMKNAGFPVPNAFVITVNAYKDFLKKSGIKKKIFEILKRTNINNPAELERKTEKIRKIIEKAKIPKEIESEIEKAYRKLSKEFGKDEEYVAVRSSATAEDIPSISSSEPVLARLNGKPIYTEVENLFKIYTNGNGQSLEIPTLLKNKIIWAPVKEFFRHWVENARLCKIVTKSGRCITISPNHSLITLDNDSFETKVSSISEIQKDTRIPVVKRLPLIVENTKILRVDEYLKDKPLLIEGKKVRIDANRWKLQKPFPLEIPITKDFAYFLGIYVSEGSTYSKNCINISCKSVIIARRIRKFLRSLGFSKFGNDEKNVRVHNQVLVSLLHELTGKPLPFKGKGRFAQTKEVPNFLFSQQSEIIAEFLKGCFDGDGYVGKNRVEFTSKSIRLIGGIVKLLELLGIKCYIVKNSSTIVIPESELDKFHTLIGFTEEKNKIKLVGLLKRYKKRKKHYDFIDTIPSKKISELLQKALKPKLKLTLVKVALCPRCGKEMIKGGKYLKKYQRYICRNCNYYPSETENRRFKVKIVKKYVYYDKFGRIKKGNIPWNKGNRKPQTYGVEHLEKIAKKCGSKELLEILNSDVVWDRIKKISFIPYSGWVYDFVIPKTQNFVSGLGGIVTHNTASFAGLQASFLNIKGIDNVIEAVKKCWASLFTPRATFYRTTKGFKHERVYIAVLVQKQLGVLPKEDYLKGNYKSGVGFTLHPATGERDKIVLEASWGQGESVVSGAITPDTYVIDKKTGKVVEVHIGEKEKMRITKVDGELEEIETPNEMKSIACLTKNEIKQLFKLSIKLDKHYKFPQDFEWASENGKVYLVQSRPVTVFYEKKEMEIEIKQPPILKGLAASPGVICGKVKVAPTLDEAKKIKKGDILVTRMTSPDWVPYMKIASGIITTEGGLTAHASIVSRELGIPCIVGASLAFNVLKDDMLITLDATRGNVYEGEIKEILAREKIMKATEEASKLKTKTKILMNLGVPTEIEKYKHLPFDGIGLMRIEFIIASWIKEHPNYLLEIGKEQKYIDKLAEGIALVAKAIYPRFVIVRFSDFKTNEYRELKGGEKFEPIEANPMLGWRGVSRFISKEFEKAFRLECKAIRKVREKFKLDNVWVMLPFVRTTWEVEQCLKIMEEEGLKRGKKFKIWLMVEVPSIVFLADEFSKFCDGFSIGSNDLTQLILGVDRDSGILTNMGYFDERNKAVLKAISSIIKAAHKNGISVSICGQAPSFYKEFCEFLVKQKIDSISVNPDAVIRTKKIVSEVESRLK